MDLKDIKYIQYSSIFLIYCPSFTTNIAKKMYNTLILIEFVVNEARTVCVTDININILIPIYSNVSRFVQKLIKLCE